MNKFKLHRNHVFPVASLLLAVLGGWLYIIIAMKYTWGDGPLFIFLCFPYVMWLLSIVVGIKGLCSKVITLTLSQKNIGIIGIVISSMSLAISVTPISNYNVYAPLRTQHCKDNLQTIYKALTLYSESQDGQLPIADKWCDLLISEQGLSGKHLLCMGSIVNNEKSNYAFNGTLSNQLLSDIQGKTVMVYESQPGWNNNGNFELAGKGHHGIVLSNKLTVLLCDGSIQVVTKKELKKLKWE